MSLDLEADADDERWVEVVEWVEPSSTLVAPKRLAGQVFDPDST